MLELVVTYFEILFDNNEFVELDKKLNLKILCTLLTQRNMQTDKDVMEKTKLKDGNVLELENPKEEVVICCMDFAFIGGSMGAVVGEKISGVIQ
jgi:acetyl-CoA carboxylase carboxyl transferase subunit beta